MSEAPERIYLDGDVEVGDGMFPRCFENPKYASEPQVEYIRADLVQAAGAAALREAVAAVKKDADNDDISQGAAQWVSDTILALITTDAQAALDRAIAAAIRKGGE